MGAEFDSMKKVKELSDGGMSQSQIAKEINRDEVWVAKTIDIMTKLPAEALEWYGENKLTRQAAEQLAQMDSTKIEAIWLKAKENFQKVAPPPSS